MRNEVGYRVRFNPPQPPQAPVYVGLPGLSPVELEAYLISFEAGGVGNLPMNLSVAGTLEPRINLLLDTYSGAAAAYSLRKLSNSYAGSCIEVQRGDGQYQNIGFDSNGDLDTASIKTFCDADTGGTPTVGTIRTWYDQSGNANNLTQSSNNNQPQIYDGSAVITEGGKPAIKPTSNQQRLLSSTSWATNDELYCFNVVRDTLNIVGVMSYVDGSTYILVSDQNSSSQSIDAGFGSVSYRLDGASWSPATRGDVYSAISTAARLITWDTTAPSSENALNLGYNADIANMLLHQELIFYNSDQSSNVSGIESDINAYYSIYS